VLDVRGLEPPEPMIRTLTALETLPAEQELLQINERVPQFLLPILAERGYGYEVDESRAGEVRVRIRRLS
jgi:TusA-related sulfurtransferase